MYVDTDVVLAELKADDWLSSEVDIDSISGAKTSVATCIEIQYAMQDEWDRNQRSTAHAQIQESEIELVPLEVSHLEAGSSLLRMYNRLNLFDSVHLGVATTLDEPIVSTDTLYPSIQEIEHVDPRDLE